VAEEFKICFPTEAGQGFAKLFFAASAADEQWSWPIASTQRWG